MFLSVPSAVLQMSCLWLICALLLQNGQKVEAGKKKKKSYLVPQQATSIQKQKIMADRAGLS